MTIVERTINAFAEPRKRAEFARDLGVPPQTVHDWLGSNNIPHWRRPAIIELSRKRNLVLEPEIAAFLASSVAGRSWLWKAAA